MPSSILAIETSSPRGSVAVVQHGAVIFERSFVSERSHNSQLFAPLAGALDLCGADLQRIVVGTGPGSYTGARIGIAAAQGLALSRDVPVIGLPSVLAPGAVDVPRDFTVCGDARRGMYFIARVVGGALAGEITLHERQEFLLARAGDATGTWFSYDAKPPAEMADVVLTSPSAARLALLASALPVEAMRSLEQQALEPVYLGAPFVTPPKS